MKLCVALLVATTAMTMASSSSSSSSSSSDSSSSSSTGTVTERRLERNRRLKFRNVVERLSVIQSRFWVAVEGDGALDFLVRVDPYTGLAETQAGTEVYSGGATNPLRDVRALACDPVTREPLVIGKDGAGNFIFRRAQRDTGRIHATPQHMTALFAADSADAHITGATFGGRTGDSLFLWVYGMADDARNGLVEYSPARGLRFVSKGAYEGAFDDERDNEGAGGDDFADGLFDDAIALSPNHFLYHTSHASVKVMSTLNGFRSNVGPALVFPTWAQPRCNQTVGTVCGNNVCEVDAENCANCPEDCRGKVKGVKQFCCGGAVGTYTADENATIGFAERIGCDDARCTAFGHQCFGTTDPDEAHIDEDLLHDFEPSLQDLAFEPEFGGLYGILVTRGNPLDFDCATNDHKNLYWWFVSIDVHTGAVEIIRGLPQGSRALTICPGISSSEFESEVRSAVETTSGLSVSGSAPSSSSSSSSSSSTSSSDFAAYVDNYVKELFASDACVFDLTLEGSSEGSTSAGATPLFDSTVTNLISSGDVSWSTNEGPDGAPTTRPGKTTSFSSDTNSDPFATVVDTPRVNTFDGTSSLSSNNLEIRLAADAKIRKHFDVFTYEIDLNISAAANVCPKRDCAALRAQLAARFQIDASEIVLLARTRGFEEPRFVRHFHTVANAECGSNRVEFIIKQCSPSAKAADEKLAEFCRIIAECGDSGVRDESGYRGPNTATEITVDPKSCPLSDTGALATCLAKNGDATCPLTVCHPGSKDQAAAIAQGLCA